MTEIYFHQHNRKQFYEYSKKLSMVAYAYNTIIQKAIAGESSQILR